VRVVSDTMETKEGTMTRYEYTISYYAFGTWNVWDSGSPWGYDETSVMKAAERLARTYRNVQVDRRPYIEPETIWKSWKREEEHDWQEGYEAPSGGVAAAAQVDRRLHRGDRVD